jgi:FAD/FMN-containing dehydrogenase
LAPIRAFGVPLADLVGPLPYCQLQAMLDASVPFGLPRYWKSGYFTDLSDELIDLLIAHAAAKPSPLSAVVIFHMHGAAARVSPESTAFALRRTQWDLDILAQWSDPATADANIAWARAFWEAVAPYSAGVYVNHLDSDDGARVRAAYGANYARLVELKRQYDPANLFRLNHNIAP